MSDPRFEGASSSPDNHGGEGEQPIIRDKRRIDPETGQPREHVPDGAGHPGGAQPGQAGGAGFTGSAANPEVDRVRAELVAAQAEAAERTDDLQRLQAEYVNYRKRVDRDRELAGELGVRRVIDALIPVLDDIDAAREYGQLDGPFKAVAEKLEDALAKFGWARYGQVADAFDPTVHEALTIHDPVAQHADAVDKTHAETGGPAVTMVMQPGHRVGEYVLRPARVGVSEGPGQSGQTGPAGHGDPGASGSGGDPSAQANPATQGGAPPSADTADGE